MTPFFVFLPVM